MLVIDLQPENTEEPNEVQFGKLIFPDNEVHPLNAEPPIDVTFVKFKLFKFIQLLNAYPSIIVTFDKSIVFNNLQLEKE